MDVELIGPAIYKLRAQRNQGAALGKHDEPNATILGGDRIQVPSHDDG